MNTEQFSEKFESEARAAEARLLTDGNGKICGTDQAAAALMNVEARFLIGKPLAVFVQKADNLAFYGCLAQVVRSRQSLNRQLWMRPRHRKPFYAALTITTVRENNDRPEILQWTLRDITPSIKERMDRLSVSAMHNGGSCDPERELALLMEWTRQAAQEQHAAILKERKRIAREIHDTLAQSFAGIALQLDAAEALLRTDLDKAEEHIARARCVAQQSLTAMHDSIWALRQPTEQRAGWAESLEQFAREQVRDTGITLCFQRYEIPYSLDTDQEHNLLRIGQEALTNALQHSQAREITIEVGADPRLIWLRVQDDGQGFDMSQLPAGSSYGLTGMQERARQMLGHLIITSHPGEGTEVQVVVPAPDTSPSP